jgi:hypothetical protein
MTDTEDLLNLAADADYWDFAIRLGEGVEPDEYAPNISARFFNTIVHFIAPTDDKPAWRLAEQRLDTKQPNRMRTVGEVRTAQVIDVVPGSLERWVLRATQEVADSLLSADEWAEDSEKATHLHSHGLRLSSECEQAEAHSRRWQERFDGQYGEIVIYELRGDEPIVYERTEEDGRPALLMGNAGENAHVILVAPDANHPWRRSSPGHVEEYGRRISIHEALVYVGDGHHDWVIEQTALALGDTLAALREVQDGALGGRDPQALAELTRLADHARSLSEGLQKPLA